LVPKIDWERPERQPVLREGWGRNLTLREAIAAFGSDAKTKLSNVAATGEPEDQLRAPLEHLVGNLAGLSGLPRSAVAAVGESSLADLKTRPDYAITVQNVLIGFIEVKAPGKGADPRKFKDRHDKQQWEKLQTLPNLIYTDGNEFSLWRSGAMVGSLVRLEGDVETSGAHLDAPPSLLSLFADYIQWKPMPHVTRSNWPRSVLGYAGSCVMRSPSNWRWGARR